MKRHKLRSYALLAALAVPAGMTVAGTTTGALAATKKTATTAPRPPASGPGLMGSIKSIHANVLTLSMGPSGTTTSVYLTSSTHYSVNGKAVTKKPTLKTGEMIAVAGTKRKAGGYTAKTIMIGGFQGGPGGAPNGQGGPGGPPPGANGTRADGTISALTGSTVTVKTSSGTSTFRITSATHYMVNGKPVTKKPTLKKGETVHVMTASKTSKVAQMIEIGSMPSGPPAQP